MGECACMYLQYHKVVNVVMKCSYKVARNGWEPGNQETGKPGNLETVLIKLVYHYLPMDSQLGGVYILKPDRQRERNCVCSGVEH